MASFLSRFGAPTVDVSDTDLVEQPSDTTSELAFSPTHDYLAVAAWNNEVRIYEINAQGQSLFKAAYSHEAPALCVCWAPDGTKVISGGADNAARMYDLGTGQTSQVAAHDAPIRCIKAFPLPGAQTGLVTGSWDKSVKYWSIGNTTPMAALPMPDRVYAIGLRYPLLVVGTADRKIQVFDIQTNPTVPVKQLESPLKFQTRTIDVFIEGTGFAIGSVEGRVAIHVVDDRAGTKSFSFRCHREDPKPREPIRVFAVNDIVFHPCGTFLTAGSDGTFAVWDKDSRTRIKQFPSVGAPVVSASFNAAGTILAYAVGYDWSHGHADNKPELNKIKIKLLKSEEVQKKVKK